jgi:hypothetical protein
VVERFVLVEAAVTHHGEPKRLLFDQHKARFHRFLDKVRHPIPAQTPALTLNPDPDRNFK